MNANDILLIGLKYFGILDRNVCDASQRMQFRTLYGVEPETARDILQDIQTDVVGESKIVKVDALWFLITLYWLKGYDSHQSIILTFHIGSRATFHKYIPLYLNAMQSLAQAKVSMNLSLFEYNIRINF